MTNIAVGIITRAAPQLNMFAFAFPVTMILAFLQCIFPHNQLVMPLLN